MNIATLVSVIIGVLAAVAPAVAIGTADGYKFDVTASAHDEIEIVNRESSKCLTENNWRKAVLLPCGKDKQTWRALASGLIKNVATNHCLFANKRGTVKVGRCNNNINRVVSKTRDGALLMHGTPSGHGIVTPVHTDISFGLYLAKRVQSEAQKFNFRPITKNPTPSPRAAPNGAHSVTPSSEASSPPTKAHSVTPSSAASSPPTKAHSSKPSSEASPTRAPTRAPTAPPTPSPFPSGLYTYEYSAFLCASESTCVNDGTHFTCDTAGDTKSSSIIGNKIKFQWYFDPSTGVWDGHTGTITFSSMGGVWTYKHA